jgi:hypothetical protein
VAVVTKRVPERPVSFVYGNLVWGPDTEEVWAVYRLATVSYEGRPRKAKLDLLGEVADAVDALETDFTLLRVSRAWSLEGYAAGAQATLDPRHGHAEAWGDYLEVDARRLGERQAAPAEVYLSARLSQSARSMEGRVARLLEAQRGERGRELRRMLGFTDARGFTDRQLAELHHQERAVFQRLGDFMACERARTAEIQWVIARTLYRGVGEPQLEDEFAPEAVVLLDDDGQRRFVPLEYDLLRLFEPELSVEPPAGGRHPRCLRVQTELGDSWQALLAFGALPDLSLFPGRRAELLYAPLEELGFPVDVAVCCRYVDNERALAMVRKGIIHADNIWQEENLGDHGPSAEASKRPELARELEERLADSERSALLRTSISLAVGAPDRDELERRVARLQRAYNPAPKLWRPRNMQLKLWTSHLPSQQCPVAYYDTYLLPEELGAMVPTATSAVGTRAGPYVAHTLSASRLPVLFDLTEACLTARPPAVLLGGTPGRGKTMTLELLLYVAFLQGSLVCDIDPKEDHYWTRSPLVAPHTQVIDLCGDQGTEGLMDPLVISDEKLRQDLATSFLVDLLPEPFPAEWRTEVRRAVQTVLATHHTRRVTCRDVLTELARPDREGGNAEARAVGRAVETYARSDLARIGFAHPDTPAAQPGTAQVTHIRIRNLPRPDGTTARRDLPEEERIGQAVLRLVTAFAMRVLGTDRSRHKVMGLGESWFLMQDTRGRKLIEHLNRWGRSEYATPILETHLLVEAEQVDNLLGARFGFGQESEKEATQMLKLLKLDSDDQRLRQQLMSFRMGACYLADYEGRVAPIQIDPQHHLLRAWDTTPGSGAHAG